MVDPPPAEQRGAVVIERGDNLVPPPPPGPLPDAARRPGADRRAGRHLHRGHGPGRGDRDVGVVQHRRLRGVHVPPAGPRLPDPRAGLGRRVDRRRPQLRPGLLARARRARPAAPRRAGDRRGQLRADPSAQPDRRRRRAAGDRDDDRAATAVGQRWHLPGPRRAVRSGADVGHRDQVDGEREIRLRSHFRRASARARRGWSARLRSCRRAAPADHAHRMHPPPPTRRAPSRPARSHRQTGDRGGRARPPRHRIDFRPQEIPV